MFFIPAILDVYEGLEILIRAGFIHGGLSSKNIFFLEGLMGGATSNFRGKKHNELINFDKQYPLYDSLSIDSALG